MKILHLLLLITMAIEVNTGITGKGLVGSPLAHFRPCKGDDDIIGRFESGLPPGEENQYDVNVNKPMERHTRVTIKFDSEAVISLSDPPSARVSQSNGIFSIIFFKSALSLNFHVKGPASGTVPYITSLIINSQEFCENPDLGVIDSLVLGYKNTAESHLSVPDDSCGRRKVDHTELITNGLDSKAGDWPWHAAIYRLDRSIVKYICGGTLISNTLVLTAAHCASIRGTAVLPEILSVIFGKFNLIGGDIATQEREVHEVILHENFKYPLLDNDIALLKLRTQVVYSDYVQPACLWYANAFKKLPSNVVFGTVVGWGFDQTDNLSNTLRQATMPKVSEATCLKSNPVFFSRVLNKNKFCAGWNNGTSACNGDSGGGFAVFVPDVGGNAEANATGAWHVRGIVSLSVARRDAPVCDPYQYVLFTDVAKYRGWILKEMKMQKKEGLDAKPSL